MKRVLALVAATVLLAACGVPGDDSPRPLDGDAVPFDLLAPTAETTTTSTPSVFADTVRVAVYLADPEGKLQAVRRPVTTPATVAKVVESLLAGPTEEESSHLSTAITSGTELLGVDGPSDGLVTINLSRDVLDITGRQQILALAQVVWTVTALPSVDRVLFEFEGEPTEVQNGNGTLTSSPLSRLSYGDLAGT